MKDARSMLRSFAPALAILPVLGVAAQRKAAT